MADVYKGLTIQFRGDTSSLSQALSKIRSESKGVSTELKQIQKAMKFNGSSPALATRQIELMKKQIKAATDQLKVYKTAERDIGKNKMSSEAWTKLQADIATTEAKLQGFKKQLAEVYIQQDAANSVLGRAGTALQNFGTKYEGLGRGMQTVGRTLTRTITPAIIAAGVASVAAAVDIDTSLTNVRKTVDGTEAQYEALKQAAIEFSKTNAVSATEILNIDALGAQLGFAIDELDQFSRVVSGLDIATNMEAEQAATELAQFANITRMAHGDVERYGSAIVDLGNNMATTESDISAMAMRIAAAGTQVGMSQADILGLAAALSSLGIQAEAGGTAISTVISNIDKAVATNSDQLQTWADTANMSAEQFAAAWKSNPVEALADVLSGMQAAVDEGGNMSLMLDELGISSLRQTDVMKRMAGNSELVANAVKISNDAWRENTALQAEVDNRNNSLAAKFEMIKNRLVAIAEQVGGPLADAFLDVLSAAEPLIQAIESGAKSFANMSKEEQQATLAAVGFAAALGPILSIVGGGLANLTNIGKAMSSLAQWFAKIGGAGKQAENAINGVATSATKGATAMGALKAGLAGLGIAAAIALFMALASAVAEAIKKHEAFVKATDGLREAVGSVPLAAEDAASALNAQGDAAQEAALSLDELIQKQGELVDSINERNASAASDIGQLESYRKTIEELAGQANLSQEDIGRLKAAVDGLNDALGTDYSVGISYDGTYQIMEGDAIKAKDAILDLIEAKKLETQYNATRENSAEAYKQESDAVASVAAKKKEVLQLEKDLAEARQQSNNIDSETRLSEDLEHAKAELSQLTATYDEATSAASLYRDQEILLAAAMTDTATAGTKFVANSGALQQALMNNQQSTMDFARQIDLLGVNTEQLATKTPEQLASLGTAYNGSIQSIVGGLDELGIKLDETQQKNFETAQGMIQQANALDPAVGAALGQMGVQLDEFCLSMAQAGLSVQDFASLTPQQLAQVVQAYSTSTTQASALMQQFVAENANQAAQAAQAWANGLSQGAQAAVAAAQQMTGLTLAQFYGLAEQFGIKGNEAVTAFANALAEGSAPADAAAQALKESTAQNLSGDGGEGEAAGNEMGANYTEGVGSADPSPASALTDSVGAQLAGADFSPEGTQAGQSYMSGFGSADPGAAGSLVESIRGTLGSADFSGEGQAAGSSYSSGIASSSVDGAGQLAQQAISQLQGMTGQFQAEGSNAGGQYASGISSQGGAVSGASSGLASNAKSPLSSAGSGAYSYGSHLGSQFASGIRSQVGSVRAAAAALAAAAKANIGHSRPKEGPLKSGEEIFGRHLAANFASGIMAGKKDVEKSAKALAQIVHDYIGHTNAAKGPLSPGEWIFGVHTATNYAEGLGSAEAKAAVSGAVEDLADAAKQAWDKGIRDAYVKRTDEIKAITKDLATFMESAFTDIMDVSNFTSARGNGTGVFGLHEEVYKSFEKIRRAGYDSLKDFYEASLDMEEKYAEARKKYAEGVADYDERIAEIRANAEEQLARKGADANKIIADREKQINKETESWKKQIEEIQKVEKEYQDFQDLRKSLDTQDLLWLAENEQIFNLQYEIEISNDQAEMALKDLQELSKKTGVVFSKSFVERIMEGSEEAFSLLSSLSSASAADVKQLSEAWYEHEQAQRMAEQATRELWVNGLQYTATGTEQLRDLLLDYKDDVLDVKEAMYGDDSLYTAFQKAGVSAEGFAADLGSVGMTMEDFTGSFKNFTEEVSNGFRAMDSFSQTSLDEWTDNLRQNIAESQAFARNVQKVFNSIPDGVDADLFRKAVLQGGFDQWGHIMADLANASSREISNAIHLYNEAINEAQQSSIDQFRAIAPGEEYMTAFMEGVKSQAGLLGDTTTDVMIEAAMGAQSAYSEYVSVGEYLAAGLEQGIYGKVRSIADAMREVVRNSIAAAKEEAEVHSPSRKMMEIGSMMGRGLGLGFEKQAAYIAKQAREVANIPVEELRRSQSAITNNNYTQTTYNTIHATIRNDHDLRTLIRGINREQNHFAQATGMGG